MMYQTPTTTNQNEAARLEDYIQAVGNRKWLVLALTLLGLLAAFLFASSRTSTYTAISTIIVNPTPVGGENGRNVNVNLDRERQVVESTVTAEGALALLEQRAASAEDRVTLGLVVDGENVTADDLLEDLDVSFLPGSDTLNVAYTSTNRFRSQATANAFANSYVTTREGAAMEHFADIFETVGAVGEAAEADLQLVNDELSQARADRTTATRSDSPTAEAEVIRLDGIIGQLSSQSSILRAEANAANNTIRAARQQDATRQPAAILSRRANTPEFPDGIGTALTLAGGLFVGLIGGVVIAFLLERLDTTARDEEDVALALGTTVMGSIPTLGFGHRGGASSLVMLSAGGSARMAAAREAFRRLRSSLQFLNTSSGVSSLIVTSSAPAEGKSLTSANLSIALAQNGSRVVLVSADLRRPSLEKLFGMEANRPGLSEYLSNTAELNAEKVPGIENMWLIRSGRPPANPGELLNSDRFEQMVKELERENVEYIVVDTPPVLSTADAVSAARYVDGVIVVVDTERTETADLLQVRADLERSGSKLLGAVMNRRKFERGGIFRRDKYAYYRADAQHGG